MTMSSMDMGWKELGVYDRPKIDLRGMACPECDAIWYDVACNADDVPEGYAFLEWKSDPYRCNHDWEGSCRCSQCLTTIRFYQRMRFRAETKREKS